MRLTDDIFDCFAELLTSYSPDRRLIAFMKMFKDQQLNEYEREKYNNLIEKADKQISEKKLQGSIGGKTRAKNKIAKETGQKPKSYKIPFFSSTYAGGDCCSGCSRSIPPGEAFIWKRNGIYEMYHTLSECHPEGTNWREIFAFRKFNNEKQKLILQESLKLAK